MFLLVPAYLGSPGQKAVKRLCVCVCFELPQFLYVYHKFAAVVQSFLSAGTINIKVTCINNIYIINQ